jgi:hypothetical protein
MKSVEISLNQGSLYRVGVSSVFSEIGFHCKSNSIYFSVGMKELYVDEIGLCETRNHTFPP